MMSLHLNLSQVAFGLGRGVLGASANRMGVWTQGCSLPKCPGCVSTHTWSPSGGKTIAVDHVIQLATSQKYALTGLTISGGEPSDQAEAVMALITKFRAAFPDTEIVLYTGLRWRVLVDRHPRLVALLDVAITGPYVHTCQATPLTGSGNQEVRLLSPLAERLYLGWQTWPRHVLQVGRNQDQQDQLVTVGIPHAPRLERAAKQAGAVSVTWDKNQ